MSLASFVLGSGGGGDGVAGLGATAAAAAAFGGMVDEVLDAGCG